jgi:lysophospholipase L1-like esterase
MLRNLALLFLSLFVALAGFEGYLRLTEYNPWMRTSPGEFETERTEGNWYEVDDEFGWLYNRNVKRFQKDFDHVVYAANKDGLRDAQWNEFDLATDQTTRILIFGDSQTAGYGVYEEARFSNVLRSLVEPDESVYNFSVAGWGLDQMYLAFLKFVPIAKPKIVVISYIHNDLLRALESYRTPENINKPSFEVVQDGLKRRTPQSKTSFSRALLQQVYVLNFFYKTFGKPYLAKRLNQAIAGQIIDYAEREGIKLIFLRIPSKKDVVPVRKRKERIRRFQRTQYNHWVGIDTYLRSRSQVYIDPTELMRDKLATGEVELFLPNDSHLNDEGHRLMAELIVEEIRGSAPSV